MGEDGLEAPHFRRSAAAQASHTTAPSADLVELKEWDAVRVPPRTWRGYEASSSARPNLGDDPREDVDARRDWWAD